jgi:hypothetical protein
LAGRSGGTKNARSTKIGPSQAPLLSCNVRSARWAGRSTLRRTGRRGSYSVTPGAPLSEFTSSPPGLSLRPVNASGITTGSRVPAGSPWRMTPSGPPRDHRAGQAPHDRSLSPLPGDQLAMRLLQALAVRSNRFLTASRSLGSPWWPPNTRSRSVQSVRYSSPQLSRRNPWASLYARSAVLSAYQRLVELDLAGRPSRS